MLTRIFLGYVVLMLAGFGVYSLLNPEGLGRLVGLEVTSTTALSDIRAVYGGLEIALAIFLVWCMLDPSRLRLALGATALAFAFVAAGRGFGMLMDRPVTALTVRIFLVEASTALVALLLAGRQS